MKYVSRVYHTVAVYGDWLERHGCKMVFEIA